MNITRELEAYDLAKLVLNNDLKYFFKDAKIVGENKERRLCFYFSDSFVLALFEKEKENILQRLREEYKKKLEFYKRIDLVFYSIAAKGINELKARSKEEQEVLERGLCSSQVLKANMKIVGNCEYALILYREKLPKFNNDGKMIYNCMDWQKDEGIPKVHPTQKPVKLLERLITIFTDAGDVVIDPCAGSGSTLLAATNLNRKAYGFEIKKDFFKSANEIMFKHIERSLFA
ncbi:TPA: site-specific DNA-methyltransferase [Campylobacter coli]|nr:site-specific DNA-methyltransferase [Campylobacter coli]HEB7662811.1 site-specific DNA-methyltransferase [Campylobacter coli]